jgi:hypothetical protein
VRAARKKSAAYTLVVARSMSEERIASGPKRERSASFSIPIDSGRRSRPIRLMTKTRHHRDLHERADPGHPDLPARVGRAEAVAEQGADRAG